ncbi:MAG: hypothetical protein IJU60_04875 [Acholeplasmatales bacterium]|nr:hypothetical protein [Acholeplasmatales bacterium]
MSRENQDPYILMTEITFKETYPNAFESIDGRYDNFPHEKYLLINRSKENELPTYTAIDNTTGDAWTEDFGCNYTEAVTWLYGDNAITGPHPIYKIVIIPSPQRMQRGAKKKCATSLLNTLQK